MFDRIVLPIFHCGDFSASQIVNTHVLTIHDVSMNSNHTFQKNCTLPVSHRPAV